MRHKGNTCSVAKVPPLIESHDCKYSSQAVFSEKSLVRCPQQPKATFLGEK
jgi:hypothetical protein